MDDERPQSPVLMPGAPVPADGIGAYPLFVYALGVSLRNLPSSFFIYLPIAAITNVILMVGAPTIVNPDPAIAAADLHIPPSEILVIAGCLLFGLSFGAWSIAAVLRSSHAALTTGRALGVGEAYGSAIDRVPSYVATQFLFVSIMVLGFFACCIPGIWWGVILAPALPRSATRAVGPIQALRESKWLVRGRFWSVAGFLSLVGVTTYALTFPSFMLPYVLPHGSTWVRGIVGTIAASILVPIQCGADVALHERLEETA